MLGMPGGPPRNFSCPKCGATYKVVRVPKPDSGELQSNPISCIGCNYLLPPGEDGFVLKYVMISRFPHNGVPLGAHSNRQ
jgi:hypothetical protein